MSSQHTINTINRILDSAKKDEMHPAVGLPARGCLLHVLKYAHDHGGFSHEVQNLVMDQLHVSCADIAGIVESYDYFGIADERPAEELYHRLLKCSLSDAMRVKHAGLILQHEGSRALPINQYIARGGYSNASRAPAEILEGVRVSGLRGRGGAGFSVWMKWNAVVTARKETGQTPFLVVNADEGEPPTVKDRALLLGNPHRLLDGMRIAAHALGATCGVIYLRGDAKEIGRCLERAIREAERAQLLGQHAFGDEKPFFVRVFMGGGSYVAGADTAMIRSIEGHAARSRAVPPYPAEKGILGRPTVVNNVETIASLPVLFEVGPHAFSTMGCPSYPGPKIWSICGSVQFPCVFETKTTLTLRDAIETYGRGVQGAFRFAIVGGISSGIVTDRDTPLTPEGLRATGAGIGSGAICIVNEEENLSDVCRLITSFYAEESCGNCVPCNQGLRRVVRRFARIREEEFGEDDLFALEEQSRVLARTTLCGLGASGLKVVLQILKYSLT